MPPLRDLEKPKQLLVEGRDCLEFFNALLRHMRLDSIQVQDFGGTTELGGFLKALVNHSTFVVGGINSLGVVRDADEDARSAFASVQGALRAAGLPAPKVAGETVNNGLRIAAMILPDNDSVGMLETLCLRAVEDDPAMECIDEYFSCLEKRLTTTSRNVPKARTQAFLASRDRPGLLIGQAAQRGYWPWESPAFDGVKRFLEAL